MDIVMVKRILNIPTLLMSEFEGGVRKGKHGVITCNLLGFNNVFLHLMKKENIAGGILGGFSVLYVKSDIIHNEIIAQFVVDIGHQKVVQNSPKIYSKIYELPDSTSPEALVVGEMNKEFARMKAEILEEMRVVNQV
jgi:hypothetical protein